MCNDYTIPPRGLVGNTQGDFQYILGLIEYKINKIHALLYSN